MNYTIQLVEYMLGIELKDEEWEDPVFKVFLDKCCKSIIYWNDIVSFRKELIESKGDLNRCSNMLAFLMVNKNLTIQQSVDKLMESIQKCDKQVVELEKQLIEYYSYSEPFLKFIKEVKNMIGGAWMYQYGYERYYGKMNNYPPIYGRFVFDVKKTIIIPDKNYNSKKYEYLKANRYY